MKWSLPIFILLVTAAFTAAQMKPRVVDLGKQYDNQPLKVLGCQVENRSYVDCKGIEGESDWWTHLRVIVKNVSGKFISDATGRIDVARQGNMRYASVMNLLPERMFIQLPDEMGNPSGQSGYGLEQNEVIMYRVPAHEVRQTREYLDLADVPQLDKISIVFSSFCFVDGTTWSYGRFGRIAAGQTDDLTRKLISWTERGPISIVNIEAHGRSVELGKPFVTTDPEWLKDLKITFVNKTGRRIKSIMFFFTLYEGHPMRPPMGEPVAYGVAVPNAAARAPVIEPDQSGTVGFDHPSYDQLRMYSPAWKDLAKQTTAELYLSDIVFDDGVQWRGGCYHRPDPENSGRWFSACMN